MKADQGLLQKEIRGMLKLFLNICIKQNSIGIATGHMYGSPTMGSGDQVGGGKAMKLFPSILIQLWKQHIYDLPNDKKNRVIIGSEIAATTLKNRTYPPFQKATVQLDYQNGVQPYAGILDLAIKADLIQKSGSWYSYGDERLGQGAETANKALEGIPTLLDDINKWLAETGFSTFDQELKDAEDLLKKEEK
jgi:recombination protein RecA